MIVSGVKYLSEFQVTKFTYMFKAFFDLEENGLIEHDDIMEFGNRMCHYTGWEKGNPHHERMTDILNTFYECVRDQVKAEYLSEDTTEEESMIPWEEAFNRYKDVQFNVVPRMSLKQWLNMWGRLCHGSAGISGFPIWVQLLPELFFDVADRDGDGIISKEELRNFYWKISGITDIKQLERTTNEGYRALSANGDYKLNKQNYMFAFANFLLAKGIYGPGKYLYGTFDNREIDETYKVNYNAESDSES
jgi:hypothetical protein